MSEQPPPYRPNPTLKRVEHGFESLLFNSRWLMARSISARRQPRGAALQIPAAAVGVHRPRAGGQGNDIILGVLSLIDVSLTGI